MGIEAQSVSYPHLFLI